MIYIRTPGKRTSLSEGQSRKETEKEGKKRQKKKKKKKKKKEKKKNEAKINMRSGHRPNPEWTRLLFACTISPMICPGDGPTSGRQDKARQKTRQEKKTKKQEESRDTGKNPPLSFYAKVDTRHPTDRRDGGPQLRQH